jgi:hypothetical protein
MCLDTLDDKKETKKLGKEGQGWKIFWKRRATITNLEKMTIKLDKGPGVYGEYYGGPYKVGKRNKAGNGALMPEYGAGFHVFLIKTEAKYYKRVSCGGRCFVLRKVKWQSPVVSGTQCCGLRIVVAKYMTILE